MIGEYLSKNGDFFLVQKVDERYQCSIKRQPRNVQFVCATRRKTHVYK